jgi:ribosomal protein S6--L-glutamate ligase
MTRGGRPDLGILSFSTAFYTTRRLLEAARARGLSVDHLDPLQILVRGGPQCLELLTEGAPVEPPRVVIPRIGATLTDWGLDLAGVLEDLGARLTSSPLAMRIAADRLHAHRALARAGVPVLPIAVVREVGHVETALAVVGGPPIVLKTRHGSQGRLVALASDSAGARSQAEAWIQLAGHCWLEPFRGSTPARDLRVLVVGGAARAACWRVAPQGEFRTNRHRGARVEACVGEPAAFELAECAARALGLPVAGVDLLPVADRPQGWVVLEVNATPGLEGIEAATGLDLAGALVDHARSLADQK